MFIRSVKVLYNRQTMISKGEMKKEAMFKSD